MAPVVYRGNPLSKKMIIGEAPGKGEDAGGAPFVGPAGQLLDRIFKSVGWDTNTDWYLGNVIKCRPIAPAGSYKQNFTPTVFQHQKCRPYIEQEIREIAPHTIVLLGKTAATSLLPHLKVLPMYKLAGEIHHSTEWPDITFFVMYHPAYILHSQNHPAKYTEARQKMWEHIQKLRTIVEENHG